MNKDKIIKDIRDKLNCSEEAARKIFREGLRDGMIKVRLDWEVIVTYVISIAVIFSIILAIYRLAT
jgi:DNA-binding Lrp family transcriptional regulator